MSVYVVDVQHQMHTCPGNPKPHAWDTRRTVVEVIETGPCLAPVRQPVTDRLVDCKTVRRLHEQCDNCRTIVQVRNVTYTTHTTVRAGTSPARLDLPRRPCPTCRQPMAGQLTRHILCAPASARRAA
jgi:hypothetical protein